MGSMEAVLVSEPGGVEQLRFGRVATPVAGPEELLVRVHATALNRADLLQREGRYPPPPGESEILGLEIAGVVAEKGERCPDWSVGDRVFGLLGGGGYAQYALIHRELAMPVPPSLSLEQAAAIPEVFLTAFQALHWYGAIELGDRVLIHAGASGVGTAAIQLARRAGAIVYVTASAGKHEQCRSLGAERAIDYKSENFADVVGELTAGAGANVVIDFIGGPYFHDNLRALATDGRLIILAMMGGASVSELNLRRLFAKRAQISTSTLRSRSLAYKVRLTGDFAGSVLPAFLDGDLTPVIDSVFDWTDVREAHRRMEANENAGKIVLRVRDENDARG